MAELDAEPPRRLIRWRLAWWMFSSTLFNLIAFAAIAYVQVLLEAREQRSDISVSSGDTEDASEQVFNAMLLAAPLCIALSVGGALWLSRRALAPLEVVISDASTMTAEDLKRRLPIPARNDELRDLSVALNGLFGRLDQGFQALGNYAVAASHELRTPLAVLASELEVALRRPRSPDEWQRVVSTSLAEVRHLTKLVEALLELGRAGAPSVEELETVDLGELVDQALSVLAAQTPTEASRMQTVGAQDSIWVYARSALLQQAIQELVRNGLRYSSGVLRLTLERENLQWVTLHIDDGGPGVAQNEQSAIFQPFARGEQGRAADRNFAQGQRGLGLGLAIVKSSIESCAGSVSVSVAPAGGARFTLHLRAASPS